MYDRDRIEDGYWFVAPKPSTDRTIGTGQTWYGPAIYDQSGDLVWSGAAQFDTSNIMDFRLSNVRGENLLTMLDRDREAGVLLDNSYEFRDMIQADPSEYDINAHEFNFVSNGTGVLLIRNFKRPASREEKDAVGWTGDTCWAVYQTFHELDANNNWESKFDFDSFGKIKLNETTTQEYGSIEKKCNDGWDFM